ncbi:MAG: cytochrome P450 [Chloroflexi bacterium]|nr:cytochrome P450 [Chloroflexota bacterium]
MITTANNQQTLKTTLPPGPRPLPYLGNLLAFRLDQTGYFQHLQRTYGDMVTFHLGKQPFVLLFRPEYVRYLLVENPRIFLNRPVATGGNGAGGTEGLLTIDGEKHRQQRRAVQPAFHKKQIEGYAEIMSRYTEELLDTWHVGDTVDMSRAMQGLTLRIVSKCLFSIDFSNQLDTLGSTFTDILGNPAGALETLFNIRIDNPLTSYGKRMQAFRRLDILVDTLIAQRRSDEHDRGDVLSMLLTAPDGERPGTLNDKQVHDHITTFIAAGHETTAIALAWTFYLLSQHPQIRDKLLDEIRTVLAGRTLTWEDLERLPYTDWVLNESMRLYPPAWFQARFASEDFEMDGYHFPAGTRFLMSQWVVHHRPDIWGDPEVFRPERWDPQNGQKVPPGAFFPFGGGPRICIGMPFAQFEAKLILTSILQRFIPQTVPGYQPGLNPTITLRPKNNVRVILLSATADASTQRWDRFLPAPVITGDQALERQGCLNTLLSLFGLLRL